MVRPRSKRRKNKEQAKSVLTVGKGDGITSKTVVKVPTSRAEASSNWKQLASGLPSSTPKVRSKSNRRRQNRNKNIGFEADQMRTGNQPVTETVVLNEFGFPAYDKDGKCLTKGLLPSSFTRDTRAIAIDCEMVGVGPRGVESILARVALVNEEGFCLYHKYVKPKTEVSDYRTKFSGIRPEDLVNGSDIKTVMQEVAAILKGHVLVGHSVDLDLKVLFIGHPGNMTRDTFTYFKKCGTSRKLSKLVHQHLGATIQSGEHNPIEDAQAAMALYLKFKTDWEGSLKDGGRR